MRLFTQKLLLTLIFNVVACGIICRAQNVQVLAKNLKFKYSVSSYNVQLAFTHDGSRLLFQHKDDDYKYSSLLYKNGITDTIGILSKPNYLLAVDNRLQMMLTTVPYKTLSEGHYYRSFTAVLNEGGKQIDSIPYVFRTACFLNKTRVLGVTDDSLYVFETGKGIAIRKPLADKNYTYYEDLVYQAGKIYQVCAKSEYSPNAKTNWLRIIDPATLSEKLVPLPGKYSALEIEAMPSGDIWLMGNAELEDKKSYLLCYTPKAEKVTWTREINAYTTDWGIAKNDRKLFTGTGIGFVTDSAHTLLLNSEVPGTQNKIVSRLGVQQSTGLVALFYHGQSANSELFVYNMRSGKVEQQLSFNSTSPFSQKLLGIQWHPTKKMFAFYVEDKDNSVSVGTISFLDDIVQNKPASTIATIKTPGIVLQDAHSYQTSAISFNKEGNWMVSGDMTGRVNIWDAKSKLIYNKIFLGGSGENDFQSTDRLPLAVHPTQKMFAVSFLQNYVFLMDFDGNYLDKIAINRYSNLLHFTADGQYLIMSTYNNPGELQKYNLKQKRIESTNKNAHTAAQGVVAGNLYGDSRYYYDPQAGALVKINLLTTQVEKSIPFKTDKKIVMFDVSADETAAILLTEYFEFFYIDLTSNQSIRLSEAATHPMGTFQPGFNGQPTIQIPLVTFVKLAPDNAGILLQIEYRRENDLTTKYYGVITAPIDKVNKRLGQFAGYQQPLITTAAISYQVQPQTDYLWTGNTDGSLFFWDLRLSKQAGAFGGNSKHPGLLDVSKQFDGMTISMSADQSGPTTLSGQNFIRFDFGSAEVIGLEREGYAPSFIHTATDKKLITHNLNNLLSIDLQSKKEVIDTNFFYKNKIEYLDGHMLYATPKTICYYNAQDQTVRWFENGKQVKSVHFPADIPLKGKHRFDMDRWSFNADSTKLYAQFTYVQVDDDGRYETWRKTSYHSLDMKTGTSTRLKLTEAINNAKDFYISGDNLLFTKTKLLYRYNFTTAKLDSTSMLKPISTFASDYRDKGVYSNGHYAVAMYNLDTIRSFNQQYINASIISMQSLKAVADFPLKYSKVESFDFSRDNRLLFVLYYSEVEIRDVTNGKLLATLAVLPGNKFIIYTPDNYYYASQKLTDIAFRTKGKVYGVEQFDLKYNRPDIVLKRLGYAPANLIDIYKKAYLKRLQRLNFTEERVNDETEPPAIELVNRLQIPAKNTTGTVSLKLKCATPGSLPDRISVSVNDVPIYGIKGYKVTGAKGAEYTAELPIKLMNGQNRIKYSVYNTKGAKSLSENIDVVYEPAIPVKSKVYFAGIGVSTYKDSRMNLKYADKDIRDIATEVKAKFAGSEVITLLNADATVANIKQLKQKFMQTNVDDIIILYISGHGLLNNSADFFYATYETNFTAPDLTALPYKDIEELLDGVPARKKLVMIDACHSGEADKTDKALTAGLAANVKPTLSPGAKGFGKTPTKQQTGLQNSFMLMQNLFVDLNEGSGAVVISAAAGDSFALESPRWNNGIFTYSVIKALKDNEADYNKDQQINLSELRKYVYETVSKETGGKQHPTTREENLGFDWQVW